MEKLVIEESIDTPGIVLDAENNVFEIAKKSYPEDTHEFYAPVLKWMDDYVLKPNTTTTFVFKFSYFNSASYKPILDIIMKLQAIKQNGLEVKIDWYYKSGDLDMKEAGEEFADLVSIPFSFRTL